MKNPNKNSFNINKVKLLSGGGLTVKFDLQEVIGAETYHSEEEKKSTKEPHPDLSRIFKQMGSMVAQVYCYTSIKTVLDKPEFKATKDQKVIVDKLIEELKSKISVTGVSISGSDDKIGVVITAMFTADTNQKMAINTHRLAVTGTKYGFEEDLEVLIDDLKEECYEYLYNNKVQNPEMFGEEDFTPKKTAVIDGTGEEFEKELMK